MKKIRRQHITNKTKFFIPILLLCLTLLCLSPVSATNEDVVHFNESSGNDSDNKTPQAYSSSSSEYDPNKLYIGEKYYVYEGQLCIGTDYDYWVYEGGKPSTDTPAHREIIENDDGSWYYGDYIPGDKVVETYFVEFNDIPPRFIKYDQDGNPQPVVENAYLYTGLGFCVRMFIPDYIYWPMWPEMYFNGNIPFPQGIRIVENNEPPKADFEYNELSYEVPFIRGVYFDASKSTGKIKSYLWEFGDGLGLGSDKTTITHMYNTTTNSVQVTLTVIDLLGRSNSITKEISFGDIDTKDFDINNENPIPALEPVLASSGMAYLLKETYENVKYTEENFPQELILTDENIKVNNALDTILTPLVSFGSSLLSNSVIRTTLIIGLGSIITLVIGSSAPFVLVAAMFLLLIRNSGIL